MRARVRQARQGGFTLLEVVVAIALFALLMTLVYSALGTSVRAYEAGQERTDEATAMRVLSEFLRLGVAGAQPIAVAEGRDWQLLFDGDASRLHYVADLPGHVGAGGLHDIVVESERHDDHQRLMMRRRPLLFDDKGEQEGEFDSRVLLEHLGAFSVRFYGVDSTDDAPTWRDSWSAARRMPLLVELTIEPEHGARWPVLQVRPRVDGIRFQGRAITTAAPATGGAAGDRVPAPQPAVGDQAPAGAPPAAPVQ